MARAGQLLVASGQRAFRELCWRPRFTNLRTIVETAWRWHSTNPHGYGPALSLSAGLC